MVQDLGIETEQELLALQEALENAQCPSAEVGESFWDFNWVLGSKAYAGLISDCIFMFNGAASALNPEIISDCTRSLMALNKLLKTGHYNRNDLMADSFDLADYTNPDGTINKEKLQTIYPTIDLLDASESIYHQRGIDSQGNLKFADNRGNEFVFSPNGDLVVNSVNMGTYNFSPNSMSTEDHIILDILPYWFLGNTRDDPTTFLERVIPSWMGGGYPDDYDPNWTADQRRVYDQTGAALSYMNSIGINSEDEMNSYIERFR